MEGLERDLYLMRLLELVETPAALQAMEQTRGVKKDLM